MSISIFIDGADGTTGLEIRERLAGRSEFEIIALPDEKRKDTAARREALNECDFAILCLPDDAAREAVALVDPASKVRIIDASSAHRVADGWTYGFPELIGKDTVSGASRVSNPGCYPTGFLGLVAPLIRCGLLHRDGAYCCNAVSGYSGGGKALIARFEGPDAPAFRSYALDGHHKHLAEMGEYAELAMPPIFAPAVIPAYRGMMVEIPLMVHDISQGAGHTEVRAALAEFYTDSAVINVATKPPPNGELILDPAPVGWDSMELHVLGVSGEHVMRLVATLDNLGKGASGAAVQSLNLMAGLPETTGLRLTA